MPPVPEKERADLNVKCKTYQSVRYAEALYLTHNRQFQSKDGMTLGGRRAGDGFELIRQKWLFENALHGGLPSMSL